MAGASEMHDIAVIGMACRFPQAPNLNSFWRLVRDGKVAFEEIGNQRWNHASFYSPEIRASNKTYATKGAFLTNIDEFAALHFGIPPRRLQVMDPQHRLVIETAREAIQDAGYDTRRIDKANTGVFVGASVSEYKDILTSGLRAQSIADGSFGTPLSILDIDALKSAVSEVAPIRAFTLSGSLLNMVAASISQTFDFAGPSFTLDAACSSALVAIHEAAVHLRSRQCNVALAGGVYLNLTPDNLVGFSRLQAISLTGECRPFDAQADGFVMGEGVGIVLLKRLADARHDGDRIYAVIRGTGCSNDGRSDGPMTPMLQGQLTAIERAYHDAGDLSASTVGFIEAHGTATKVGDAVEFAALNTFFNKNADDPSKQADCFIGSVKANIGHTMSAAGAAGFIKAVLAIQHAVVPPHPSIGTPNPVLQFDRSRFELTPIKRSWPDLAGPRRAAVSSFGFGGTNAHLLLEQAPESGDVVAERDELFLISAPTSDLLSEHLAELADAIEDDRISPASVAYTLAIRAAFDCRVAFVAKGATDLLAKLRQAANSGAAARAFHFEDNKLGGIGRSFVAGATVDAARLMQQPDHKLGTLPPTPLERQRFWAIESAERTYWNTPAGANAALIDAGSEELSASSSTSTASLSAGTELRHQVEQYILASVADISAFPPNRLRTDQRLVGELGFDSLMLADLEEDIRKQWPQASKLPFESLPPQTTIADLSEYVLRQLRSIVVLETDEIDQTTNTGAVIENKTSVTVSRSNDVYLNDHVIAGHCVLPFAVAMNYFADAATRWTASPSTGFAITDFHAVRPVVIADMARLEIRSTTSPDEKAGAKTEITLRQDGIVCYRAGFSGSPPTPKEVAPISGTDLAPPLSEFYERGTFHGPLLRGILAVDGVDAAGISGLVATSEPKSWIKNPEHESWTIDPRAIDGGLQLAAYWIWVKLGLSAIPTHFDEYVQLAPFGADAVHCTARLEAFADGKFRGSLAWSRADGSVLGVMTGVVAETKSSLSRHAKRTTQREELPSTSREPEDTYIIEQFPELKDLRARLRLADQLGISNPYFRIPQSAASGSEAANTVKEINFSSYNYVNSNGDAVVSAAAIAAIEKYGTSVSASRLASGERPLHSELENELAAFLGTERCLVFTSGHATNVSVIGHIVGPQDLVLHDELAHDSIIQGAKLSGAKRRSFPHNDAASLDQTLAALRHHYRRVLICIEGVYSMDGDIPDLPKFVDVKQRHEALLFVDEAHSLGVIGPSGRGIGEYHNVPRHDVDIWMGTLSKSFASCGGFIGGSAALIEYLKYTTSGFIYSVGITPPNAAAALAALRQVINRPERVQRLQRQSSMFLRLLKSRGINTGLSKDTAVVPAVIGDSILCLKLAHALHERGINVHPMIYPAVANESARLRFFVTCEHTDEQLERTADTLVEELHRLTPGIVAEPALDHEAPQNKRHR